MLRHSLSRCKKPFKPTAAEQQSRISVYRNLTRGKDVYVYSVRIKSQVAGYTSNLYLRDVEWFVSAVGNARVKATKVRHVHAWAKGYLLVEDVKDKDYHWERVTYNPHIHTTFVTSAGEPLLTSAVVKFTAEGVYVGRIVDLLAS